MIFKTKTAGRRAPGPIREKHETIAEHIIIFSNKWVRRDDEGNNERQG
jgi:hypothetical protein